MSFRYKFILSFILIEAFFILLIVVFNTSSLKETSEKLVAQKIDAATEIFVEIVKTPLLVNDLATLDDAASNFTAITSIAAVRVLGTSGDVLSERINQSAMFDNLEIQEKLPELMGDASFASGSDAEIAGRDFIRFSRVVSIDEEKLGEIRFIYDISDSIQTVKKSTLVTYALAGAALLISTLIAVVLGYRITRQLNSLTETANEIAHDNPVVIPTYQYSGDEINRLFGAMKTMQQKIVDRTQEMTAARSRALVASKAKSEFLAVMSHEIRTPLNGMIGSLNLMDQKKLTSEDSEHLDTVRKSSTLLTTIINDILDYSKIEAGRFSLDSHVVDLEKLIREVEQFYRPITTDKGLLLDVKLVNLTDRYVRGDGIRIKQILNNYLNNALKFTSHGNIYLTLEQMPDKSIKFSVRDTGIGINPEDMNELFTDFSQVNTGANRSFGGTGLGLAISKRLAVLMGGEVGVESVFGEGSCFWAVLRPEPSSFVEYEQQNQLQSKGDDENEAGMSANILLVEDNKVNQTVARKLLEKQGCVVTIANDGVEALDKLYGGEFDLILMDCQMPIMDGFEATRKIRQSGNDIPIIALTANAQNSDRDACLEAGMNDFLSKPFDPRRLYEMISRYG
jgi:signal transduction histidine kinase